MEDFGFGESTAFGAPYVDSKAAGESVTMLLVNSRRKDFYSDCAVSESQCVLFTV
jgi:hypothetical protein